jgi:hypothetical protein
VIFWWLGAMGTIGVIASVIFMLFAPKGDGESPGEEEAK